MYQFTYAATLTPDDDDGGFVVTFRDLPEAITQGNAVEDAMAGLPRRGDFRPYR